MDIKKCDEFPLTKMFLCEKDNLVDNSTLTWLSTVSDKTLESLKDFDSNFSDFVLLSWNLSLFEKNKYDMCDSPKKYKINGISDEEHTTNTTSLICIIDFESMRRKGLISISGEGKITNMSSTSISLTENGRLVKDSLETLDKISQMMVEEN